MKQIHAAGAVVYREQNNRYEVAVIHRPRYNDWTLPKGKRLPGESLPVCAVREVAEETGLVVKLDTPLDHVKYLLGAKEKTIHYWRAQVIAIGDFVITDEVDQLRWIDVATGLDLLTYPCDMALVQQAISLPFQQLH
ncbi:MAG: NUDIX hydrolase [Propionibacteriaceae bacterium]